MRLSLICSALKGVALMSDKDYRTVIDKAVKKDSPGLKVLLMVLPKPKICCPHSNCESLIQELFGMQDPDNEDDENDELSEEEAKNPHKKKKQVCTQAIICIYRPISLPISANLVYFRQLQ